MAINKIKISALPVSTTLVGLFTIGVDGTGKSVAVSLEFIKFNADKVAAAEAAAIKANNAAASASQAKGDADTATSKANDAAELANAKAILADNEVKVMEELKKEIIALYKLQPTSMEITYPERITLRSTSSEHKIEVTLLPANVLQNVLYQGDNKAVSVYPDGSVQVNEVGESVIHIIAPENTKIYKAIKITVVNPSLRLAKSGSLRLMSDGNLRLT
jgi:hypothetical protein